MIKKALAFILSCLMIFLVAACNKKTELSDMTEKGNIVSENVNTKEDEIAFNPQIAYSEILAKFYRLISNPGTNDELEDGEYGVFETSMAWGTEAASVIGYVFRDVNADGIDELLIGSFDKDDFAQTKNELYAGYTYANGEPVLLFEGRSRNTYSLTEDNTFYNSGSNGAIYSIFGEYALKGSELSCIDYYFSYEKNNNFTEIGFFHNTSGEWDPQKSEEMHITDEEFWKIQSALAQKTIKLDAKKFSDFAIKKIN